MDSNSVDLIYLDPPFNSKKQWSAPIGSRAAGAAFKDAWTLSDIDVADLGLLADERPKLANLINAIGDVNGNADRSYLLMMASRLIELHRILKETGSIYLHCDPIMSHSLKLVMDAIFGRKNFRNEIIWSHQGSWIQPENKYPRRHDTILFYSNSPNITFTRLYEDNFQEQINYKRWKKYIVGNKIFGKNMPLQDSRFKTYINRFEKENRRKPKPDDVVLELTGSRIGTVQYIKVVDPKSKESTKYPTQKPLKLLQRIIQASSNEGDIVFDPFCGCATTCIAAEKLNRNWIGIDISKKAIELVKQRFFDELKLFNPKIIHRSDIPIRSDGVVRSKDIKHILYGEQEGRCKGCGTLFEFRHFEVDHVIPSSLGGADDDSNLQLLCGNCNRVKGNRPMAFLRATLEERGIGL